MKISRHFGRQQPLSVVASHLIFVRTKQNPRDLGSFSGLLSAYGGTEVRGAAVSYSKGR